MSQLPAAPAVSCSDPLIDVAVELDDDALLDALDGASGVWLEVLRVEHGERAADAEQSVSLAAAEAARGR